MACKDDVDPLGLGTLIAIKTVFPQVTRIVTTVANIEIYIAIGIVVCKCYTMPFAKIVDTSVCGDFDVAVIAANKKCIRLEAGHDRPAVR